MTSLSWRYILHKKKNATKAKSRPRYENPSLWAALLIAEIWPNGRWREWPWRKVIAQTLTCIAFCVVSVFGLWCEFNRPSHGLKSTVTLMDINHNSTLIWNFKCTRLLAYGHVNSQGKFKKVLELWTEVRQHGDRIILVIRGPAAKALVKLHVTLSQANTSSPATINREGRKEAKSRKCCVTCTRRE